MFALPVTLGVFGLILVLARFRAPLGIAILVGTIVLGAAFRLPAGDIALKCLTGAVQPSTISLSLVTVLLLALSTLMRAGGQMEDIVALARAMLRRPVSTMLAMPALVGLLPMVGGAVFSAPMVESAAGSGRDDVPRGLLSAINYWFRHIWEHWWPLYPGVLLAMQITQIPWRRWAPLMIPCGLAMFLGGLLMLRSVHPDLHVKSPPPPAGTKRKLLRATSSIWMILLVWLPVQYASSRLLAPHVPALYRPVADKYAPLALGLVASLLWTLRMLALGWRMLFDSLRRRAPWEMGALVVSVLVFQYMLGSVDAPRRIGQELQNVRVPVVLVVAILPFLAGFVTGLAMGFVGTSFPIVKELLLAMDGGASLPAFIVLAYVFGHLGQMMSPIHVCQILSNQYFKTPYGPVYRYIVPSAVLTAVLSTGYFLLVRWIM
jgi:hypothetical protein